VSTFSIDVDTASYSWVRASLNQNVLPQPAAVRTEEMVNYFPYDYAPPGSSERPFSTNVAVFPSPWAQGRKLVRIGIKGYSVERGSRPHANLVFLIDTSGSMQEPNKLPLHCIGIMRIAKINLVLPIVEGLTYKNLSYALAHLQTSAGIGMQGDCCIFGHRNHTYGKYFNRLDELEAGDIISIEDSKGTLHSYTVVKKEILSPSDVNLLKSGLEGHSLTLITCHPLGVYNQRLVIRALEP
jgi:LPXTG-site transpeptidase (sortase) family protein